MMRREIDLDDWKTHFRALAESRIDALPVGAPAAFSYWSEGKETGTAPSDAVLDEALWWGVLDPTLDPQALIEAEVDGPLFTQGSSRTIEVWTERELCGMHAMWWIACLRKNDALQCRLDACARWHIENTQPDNATNRPWAAHVFLLLADRTDDASARLYAETLIHNCQTNHGVPDALSGLILLDCAEALRRGMEG